MSEKELDKFARNFLIRAVQIIVESRLGDKQLTTTSCNPRGHDWFNLSIKDIRDVAQQTKSCLDKSHVTVRDRWQFCVEISLKTSDGDSMVLEYWVVTNETTSERSQTGSGSFKSGAGSAKNSPSSPKVSAGSSPLTLRRLSFEEEVYQVYNRMSLMLKSLISITRAVPAFKLSSSQGAQSFVICYRVYFLNINNSEINNTSGTNERGCPSPATLDESSATTTSVELPLEQRLIPDSNQRKCYSSFTPLGSIISSLSKMSVSCIYREEMNSHAHDATDHAELLNSVPEPTTLTELPLGSMLPHDRQDTLDESKNDQDTKPNPDQQHIHLNDNEDSDERAAAITKSALTESLHMEDSHFDLDSESRSSRFERRVEPVSDPGLDSPGEIRLPLNAAFASRVPKVDNSLPCLPETPFDDIINIKPLIDLTKSITIGDDATNEMVTSKSNPIAIPGAKSQSLVSTALHAEMSPIEIRGATGTSPAYGSSAESFVFVDLKAPFAQPDEQELNSFFVGPSPTFSGHQLSPAGLADLSSQFAAIESNIEQWDSFVESVCSGKEDEEKENESSAALELGPIEARRQSVSPYSRLSSQVTN